MSKTAIASLQALVKKLNTERQNHLDAIARIDAAFQDLGVMPPRPKGRRGRPKSAKKKTGKRKSGKTSKRRKFKTTAEELVLTIVKKAGKRGATGAQITKAWKAAKRLGDPYNMLGMLTKAKKIKRKNVKGERGSRYTIA